MNQTAPYAISGLKAYKDAGAEAALHMWLKGSPLEGDKDSESQAGMLVRFQAFYGKFQSYDIVKVRYVTPKVQIAYLVLNYDSGPVFGEFISFKSEKGWILTTFKFNTKHDEIFPWDM